MKRIRDIFRRRRTAIADKHSLVCFIDANSAFVAQTTLYGYLKTRAGFDHFRMFEEEKFISSVNIAKWNIYAACVGDLTLFCGAHIRHKGQPADEFLRDYLLDCIGSVFLTHGSPIGAGEDYLSLTKTVRERIKTSHFYEWRDDETVFSESPDALVYWAPVADQHKQYDTYIVKNSVIFKWKEIRDKFRLQADLAALTKDIRGSGRKTDC